MTIEVRRISEGMWVDDATDTVWFKTEDGLISMVGINEMHIDPIRRLGVAEIQFIWPRVCYGRMVMVLE